MEAKSPRGRDLLNPVWSSESLESPWLCRGIHLVGLIRTLFDRCGKSGCCLGRWVVSSTHGCPSGSGGQRLLLRCHSSGLMVLHSNLFYWSTAYSFAIDLLCKSAARHTMRSTGLWTWQLYIQPFGRIVGLGVEQISAYLYSSASFLGGRSPRWDCLGMWVLSCPEALHMAQFWHFERFLDRLSRSDCWSEMWTQSQWVEASQLEASSRWWNCPSWGFEWSGIVGLSSCIGSLDQKRSLRPGKYPLNGDVFQYYLRCMHSGLPLASLEQSCLSSILAPGHLWSRQTQS